MNAVDRLLKQTRPDPLCVNCTHWQAVRQYRWENGEKIDLGPHNLCPCKVLSIGDVIEVESEAQYPDCGTCWEIVEVETPCSFSCNLHEWASPEEIERRIGRVNSL